MPTTIWNSRLCGVVGLVSVLSLWCCDGRSGKKKGQGGYTPPPPLTLAGCKTRFRLPEATAKGVSIQTTVTLRVSKQRLYTAVEHVLSAADQGEHVFFDTAREFPIHAIPHPHQKVDLNRVGKFGSQRSQTTNLTVRKGHPVRVTTAHNGGIVRGQRLEVKVHMARRGVPKGLALPSANVSAGWTGCPTVK